MSFTILPVAAIDLRTFKNLLQQNDLPAADITAETMLFALYDRGRVSGTIGLEYSGKDGLLRSLSTSESIRGTGGGTQLVHHIESFARSEGVGTLYLLTTTAAPFFEKQGYVRINREDVPPFIQATSEYRSVCPASATIMKKAIA